MACSITATAGSASANSYITIADADTYFEARLYVDDWTSADDDTKCRALQMATRMLDQWFDWQGSPVGSTQALLWPRVAAVGPNGYELASDSIPDLIAHATAEQALALMQANRAADSDVEAQGITQLTAGSVSLSFRSPMAKPIPDAVQAMVGVLGTLRGRSGGTVSLRRG